MSVSTLLREVDAQSYRRAERVRYWSRQGHVVHLDVPRSGCFLGFTASRKNAEWQGMIDLRQWLDQALPGLETLLPSGCPDHEIQRLFEAVPAPLQLPIECLRYRRLSDVRILGADVEHDRPLPAVESAQGRVWITRLPPAPRLKTAPIPPWIRSLPMPLSWNVGYSPFTSRGLVRLAPGDVLQVVDCRWEVMSSRRPIGGFAFTEEGLRMTPTLDATTTPPQEPTLPIPDPAREVVQVPLLLEFVLHEHACSVEQLAALMEGKVLPLAADSAKTVKIRACGHLVAEGELVRWEDRLGVQLHTVHRGEA